MTEATKAAIQRVKQQRNNSGRFTTGNANVIDLTSDDSGNSAQRKRPVATPPRNENPFVQPPTPYGHGSGNASAVALYPGFENYAPSTLQTHY